MARGKLLTIFVLCCMTGIYGDNEESLLDAGQGCGESGQLFDAPIPGVYKYHSKRSRRAVVADSSKLWPNGIIPYVFDNSISASGRRLVRRAMNLWEKQTCIRFKKRVNETDYVSMYRGRGCCSHVGRRRGKQSLSLGIGCLRHGIIVHELGHAIGFWHEQNRPDRGSFIDILYNNVEMGKAINFNLVEEGRVRTLDQDYDYKSIMHYGSKFFNKDGGDTIRPKEFYRIDPNVIGSRYYSHSGDILSELDIMKANIMYKCTKVRECGGTLFSSNGYIKSSSSPRDGKNKEKDCAWIISRDKNPKSTKITATFTLLFEEFNVGFRTPTEGHCEGDYLEVREGKGFLSPFLTRLCGHGIPEPITTFSDSVYIKLHRTSDGNDLQKTPPKIKIRYKSDVCSKTFVGLSDNIESPGFPLVYPTDTDCLWKIKLRNGYKIVLKFHGFGLRSSATEHECPDYLDLIEGGSEAVFRGRYCGSHSPNEVRFNTNEAIIRLHTSNDSQSDDAAAGFSASYYAEDVDECQTGQHQCDLSCSNYEGGYACACLPGYRTVFIKDRPKGSCVDIDECAVGNGGCSHKCVNTDGGFFCSCPSGLTLAANYSCVDIDECRPPFSFCSHRCQNTFGSYQCSCPPGYIIQDDQKTCKELTRCGGKLISTVGIIEPPVVPLSYTREINCQWHIKVDKHFGLAMSFQMPWKLIQNCQSYLLLKSEGGRNGEPRNVKICSKSDVLDELTFKSNSVILEYHTEKPYMKSFTVRYRSVRLQSDLCGGEVKKKHGLIKTPGFPFRYPNKVNCIWKIQGRKGLRTKITFIDFSVEFSRNCLYDYAEIEEYNSKQSVAKRIGRFCGDDLPPAIVISSYNDIHIKFVSDATVRKRGFQIQYTRL
ncbi:tolloid-like protein 2 [Rhopilema esculentum]|uniref:tolloid-like protein 2 n=1 Tax=Rhopilema esculentum TaxID=499914 RepID=UPI0031CF17FD